MFQQINAWADRPAGKLEDRFYSLIQATMGNPVVKVVLVVAFFFSFWFHEHSIMFSLAIMLGLCIHELGHLYAMRSVGLSTHGIFFIPFFGAAAVSTKLSSSRWDRFLIALMGSFTGLISVLIPFLVYRFLLRGIWRGLIWDNAMSPAQMASAIILTKSVAYVAAFNLFNLFPFPLLDGGRMVQEMIFSARRWVATISLVLCGGLSIIIFRHFADWRLALLGIFGFFVIGADLNKKDQLTPMRGVEIVLGLCVYLILLAALLTIMVYMYEEMGYFVRQKISL